jgi:hypothetical protein
MSLDRVDPRVPGVSAIKVTALNLNVQGARRGDSGTQLNGGTASILD